MYNHNIIPNIRPGADGNEVIKMHAVSRIMLHGHINNIQVSWVKEGPRMSQLLLAAGVNDFGGTLINESISTAAGAQYGQLMKPKQIRSIIRSAGRIPAQRSTTYRLLKVYDVEEDYQNYSDTELDKADPREFGSYKELIKLDTFRYRDQNKNSNR
jgi:5-amino-6-(D-ribitylamino)uracil---L-tyrosine 4-hydroxyphenyl transferase